MATRRARYFNRRPRYRDEYEDEAVPHPTPSFTWGSIVNLGGIPLLTAGAILIGQWAVGGDTLRRHETQFKEDKDERTKMRDSFMNSQTQLVSVLGKLDTRMSVTEKSQETMVRQLEKFGDLLQQAQKPRR